MSGYFPGPAITLGNQLMLSNLEATANTILCEGSKCGRPAICRIDEVAYCDRCERMVPSWNARRYLLGKGQ